MALVAGILGGAQTALGVFGQENTNKTNEAIANANNATQIELANTAITRRVQDYKNAGLNPMLAVQSQGAAVPQMQQPQLNNPFGNMGQNMAVTAAQVANMNADTNQKNAAAKLTQAQTPGDVFPVNADGTLNYKMGNGGLLGNLNAAQIDQQNKVGIATVGLINEQSKLAASQVDVNKVQAQIQELTRQQQAALLDSAIKAQQAENKAREGTAGATGAIYNSGWGPIIRILQIILGRVHE